MLDRARGRTNSLRSCRTMAAKPMTSYNDEEFVRACANPIGLQLPLGTVVRLDGVTVSSVETATALTELKKHFRDKFQACVSLTAESIHVEGCSPFSFHVLQPTGILATTKSNWLLPPFNRFAFRSVPLIHHVAVIPKGNASSDFLPLANPLPLVEAIDNIPYISGDGKLKAFIEALRITNTDAITIAVGGKIVYERYLNGGNEPHIQFSVTKSLVGLIVSHLIHLGVIDPEKQIIEYIPELGGSAFADAKVIQVLDMTTSLKYSEEYANPESDVVRHMIAAGYIGIPEGYKHPTIHREFLKTIQKAAREHGTAFQYVSANSEVLSWLVERATSKAGKTQTVNELFATLIWSKIGADQDAVIITDRTGVASWAGGFTATTRDMAKIGQMVLDCGSVSGEQILSPKIFEFMQARDCRSQFSAADENERHVAATGWSYKNQFWWTHNEYNAFMALGIHGQMIYIDPTTRMVVAKNSSQPLAEGNPLEYDILAAMNALSKHFQKS